MQNFGAIQNIKVDGNVYNFEENDIFNIQLPNETGGENSAMDFKEPNKNEK